MLTQLEVDQIIEGWPQLPGDLKEQIRSLALPGSRYLFFRKGKAVASIDDLLCGTKSTVYYGFCTHCQKQSPLADMPNHNGRYTCPSCGSVCTAKKHGLGTKHLCDSGYFNLVQADHNRLYIRQLWVKIDYRVDKLHPQLDYYDEGHRWMLSAEGCCKLTRKSESYHPKEGWKYRWTQQKSFTIDHQYAACCEITQALLNATYMKNSHAYEYLSMTRGGLNDLIRYADAFGKHPNIESLVNQNTLNVATEYIEGKRAVMNRIIDWKKVRPHEMLRVQKEELSQLMQQLRRSPYHALC